MKLAGLVRGDEKRPDGFTFIATAQAEWSETPHEADEPTAPYITGRTLNLKKLPGRQ